VMADNGSLAKVIWKQALVEGKKIQKM
jgi:hypothetical protein